VYLELRNISKHFASRDGAGEVRAVDDVTIDIAQGQFVTLLGPSGCGKTTTLRLIAGFEFPTHGAIILDGRPIDELPPNKRDMAMVFQSYAIFPHLNVYENIAYGLKIKKLSAGEIKRKVAGVLALTELGGLENRAPNQLSGGQQQRVALARALVMEPKVLLFDEPLSNLDAKLRVQMRSEIRRIQQELGITSVYVTHDQDEAMVLSDLIVIMHQGRVQQSGSAVQIYRRPANRFVADFIGRANFLPVTVLDRAGAGREHAAPDDTRCRIKLGALELTAPAAADMPPGTQALLLVRPESLRLNPQPPPSGAGALSGALPGALTATIARTSYLGSLAEYEIDLAGQRLVAVRHDPREEDLYAPGAIVAVELLRDNIYLLPGS
jgi:iron(III) transport system ATP-binding protein